MILLEAKKKALIIEETALMVVTTSTGKTFDADLQSRVNMLAGLHASQFVGLTSTNWKLSDNSIVGVTLVELGEASLLALQKFGEIRNIIN